MLFRALLIAAGPVLLHAAAPGEFEAALRVDANDSLALGMLGAIRLAQGQLAPAIALLTKAMELDPDDVDVRQNLKLARQRQGAQ